MGSDFRLCSSGEGSNEKGRTMPSSSPPFHDVDPVSPFVVVDDDSTDETRKVMAEEGGVK